MFSLKLFALTPVLLIMTQGLMPWPRGQTVTRHTWWKKTSLTGVRFLEYKGEFRNTTIITCAGHCSSNQPCMTFSVHPVTGRCLLYENRVMFGFNMTRDEGYEHHWVLSEHCPTETGYVYNASVKVCYSGELDNRVPWTDAQMQCQSEGGHLYVANTQEKLDIITQYVLDNGLPNVGVKLGAHDLFEEGWWRWLDGSSVAQWMWFTDQPDNRDGLQHCIEPMRAHPDFLGDGKCTSNERFMCEIPVV